MNSEAFAVTATINGSASNGLPFLHHEVATLEVPGIGTARVGMHVNMAALFIMLPGSGSRDPAAPPHLFTLKLTDLFQAATAAAVDRYQTGEPTKPE